MTVIIIADRVKETSHSGGTGDFILDGAVSGFSSFADVFSSGDTVFYAITDGVDYEVGQGVYTSGANDTLERTVISSSNSDNLVDFPSASVKEVFVTYPSKRSVYTVEDPDVGSLAFWNHANILSSNENLTWDEVNERLGLHNSSPQYEMDVTGIVRSTGFVVTDQITFLTGDQTEHFLRNDLDESTGIQDVITLSGDVDQTIGLSQQNKGTFFAGPPNGCTEPGCSPDYPSFRAITVEDIPDLSSVYVEVGNAPSDGADGLGWTGGSYNSSTGIITFSSDDGLEFTTGDLRGSQGNVGPTGPQGEEGDSAYEIAVANGFVGTEQEWLDTFGQNGLGWTGGSYDSGTGIVTFTSDDGLGFATDDLRGATGPTGPPGNDGNGWTGGSYDAGTGIVTFTSVDGLGFSTGDLRGAQGIQGEEGDSAYEVAVANGFVGTESEWLATFGENGDGFTGGSYNSSTGIITFTSDDGIGFSTDDVRGESAYQVAVNNGFVGTESEWLATFGENGDGFTGGSYDAGTGIVTFTSDDGLGFSTGDLRGATGASGADGADGANVTDIEINGSNHLIFTLSDLSTVDAGEVPVADIPPILIRDEVVIFLSPNNLPANTSTDITEFVISADYDLTEVRFYCNSSDRPSGSVARMNLKKNGVTVFSANPEIDADEYSSLTSSTPGTLSSNPTVLADGDLLSFDLEQVGSSNAGRGYYAVLIMDKHTS